MESVISGKEHLLGGGESGGFVSFLVGEVGDHELEFHAELDFALEDIIVEEL